jgi:hypothetical protein
MFPDLLRMVAIPSMNSNVEASVRALRRSIAKARWMGGQRLHCLDGARLRLTCLR